MTAVAQAPAALPSTSAPSVEPSSKKKDTKPEPAADEKPAAAASEKPASKGKPSSRKGSKAEDNNADKKKDESDDKADDAKSPSEGKDNSGTRFDLEPNPFEQSFSRPRPERTTPPRGGDATSTKHNALPPLSSLTSPAAADPSQFPWLAGQSLRSGPLSPAMLAGPAGNNANNNNNNSNNQSQGNAGGSSAAGNNAQSGQGGGAGGNTNAWGASDNTASNEENFEPGNFRTGFTPGTGSGFTPGYNALLNSNFGSLPMPSPNTAAFLNSITNVNENVDGNSQGQGGPNGESRHAPSAIPPHLHQPHGMSHLNPAHAGGGPPQETITPNTLNALTNAVANQPQGPVGAFYPPGMHPGGPAGPLPPGMAPQPVDYAQQNANAASQAANGLFLLSQAHQELSKREEEARSTPPASSKRGGGASNASSDSKPNAGNKRKEPATKANNGPKKNKKMSVTSEDEDDDDDMKDDGKNKDDKPRRGETEEEKRRNFLERNRQAALKCRQRKKAWLNELQNKTETLQMENERLQHNVRGLEDEVARLTSILMQHRECGLAMPPVAYGRPLR